MERTSSRDTDRKADAILRTQLIAGPFAVLHVLDLYKGRLNLESVVKINLQKAILRRYLQYTEDSRKELARCEHTN